MTGSLLALFYGSYRLIIRSVAIMRRNGKKDQRKRASGQFHLVGKATRKCSPKDRFNTYIEKMILVEIRQFHMMSAKNGGSW